MVFFLLYTKINKGGQRRWEKLIMRDLIDKRNELNKYLQRLRTLKFDTTVFNPINKNNERITKLIKEQNEVYQRFIFYKEYLKELNKGRKR